MEKDISPILIIGAAGFVGNHLIRQCKRDNIPVYATKLPFESIDNECSGIYELNILDKDAIIHVLNKTKPKSIIHLAAQSSVGLSWDKPDFTIDVNIKGSINVLEAVREYDVTTRVLMISSSEEYGKVEEEYCTIDENHSIKPMSPYAVTKAAQTMFSQLYVQAYRMDIITMRAFNHIGPGQKLGFVVPDFCSQIVEIEKKNKKPIMYVGNLEAERDFTDVRDIVKGYLSVLRDGESGECYNIGSGQSVSIQTILDHLLDMANEKIHVEQDEKRMRPSDVKVLKADISKIQRATGYQPEIPLDVTLQDTLNYFRGM